MADVLLPSADPSAVVERRTIVPSERELAAGADAPPRPEVTEPGPALPRRSWRIRMPDEGLRASLDPRRVSGGHDPMPLVLLGSTALFTSWDDAAFSLLAPEIRDDFGLSLSSLGVIGVVFTVASLLLAPAAGWLADRVRRVRLVQIGAVSANLASVTAGLSPNVPTLLATRAAAGVTGSLTGPSSFPLLTDYYPQDRRARVFAFQGMNAQLGLVLGPLVAGALGSTVGWRPTLILLGTIATAISFFLLKLREPVRGGMDRRALGASDDVADVEQPPVTWAEGWRAAASIHTLRRLWFATPFMTAAGEGIGLFLGLYYAEEFGLGPFGRGMIASLLAILNLVGLSYSGPIGDRLLQHRPQRVMALFGAQLILGCGVIAGLALSPYLWLSVLISLPLTVTGALILPAQGALVSMVVPARLRAFGLQTTAPWRFLGILFTPFVFSLGDSFGLRAGMLMLVPLFLVGAVILTSATTGVARDIRAATAAAMADEVARRARATGQPKMLVCREVDVAYDGTQVLFDVDLDVASGELVALLGTNGAGKSTLLRAISGIQEASGGAVFLDGREITHRPPHQNAADGIVFVPGGRAIFPSLTVGENLRAAGWMHRADETWVAERTEAVLELFGELRPRLQQEAGTLSGGEQQMVALGQALLMRPRLLMIDELSLGLAPVVVERLLDAVRAIHDQGTTVILVEQSVNVALTVAHRAVFMEKGRILFDGPTPELLARADLVRAVFLSGTGGGRRVRPARSRPGSADPPEAALAVAGVRVRFGGVQALDGAAATVAGGEIVGIIGPNGAGKTTLFDVISGYVSPDEGTVHIDATEVTTVGADARARLGLGRSFQNARLFPSMRVQDTVAVALERHLANRSALVEAAWLPKGRASERRAQRRVEWLIDLLNLEAYAEKFIGELSTGSRRMVDLACVMASEPRVLLLDEPSSGLAQAEIEALGPVIRRVVADTGCGVLLIEHDIPLVTGVADRLIAMETGRPIATGTPDEVVNDPTVVAAYLGASRSVIDRSGAVFDNVLAAAGIDPSQEPKEAR